MPRKGSSNVMRVISVVAVIASLLVGTSLLIPRYHRLRQLQSKRAQLERDNRLTESKIVEIENRIQMFDHDPAFVEKTAREAGMIKTNEMLYRVAP